MLFTLLSTLHLLTAPMRARLRSDDGLEAVEYALIAALIAVVVIGAVTTLGTNISAVFNQIATTIAGTAGNNAN